MLLSEGRIIFPKNINSKIPITLGVLDSGKNSSEKIM